MRRLRNTIEAAVAGRSDSQQLANRILGAIIESLTIVESDDLQQIPSGTRIKDRLGHQHEMRQFEGERGWVSEYRFNAQGERWCHLNTVAFPAIVEEWGDES